MSVRHLDELFRPRSIAVIGASNRPRTVGAVMIRNLLRGGFAGPILPVHPREEAVAGVLAYRDVASLPLAPDLAVLCTPPPTVPGLVDELGARGTRAIITITAGLTRERTESGRTLQDEMLARARPHVTRILGPNCLGLIVPGAGLNASFAHADVAPGRIAFVSQSGALCASVLDWARSTGIGFSHFVSLGDIADVDFGDVLDYLGSDPQTDSILLYIESIGVDEARKFMSAARSAARNKPVVVVKSGRAAEGARAAMSHTGALAGSDAVYDAAIRRAGMLRVFDMDELFDAVETLARARPLRGDRLAIVTNGGGPGVLATDALVARGGRLAVLAPETIAALDAALPPTWSGGNPVDIIGDAPGERYAGALRAVLHDRGVDAVLVMNVPTAIASSLEAAQHVVEVIRSSMRPVFTNWLGRDGVGPARQLFRAAGIPTYDTPDDAVRAFSHMVDYRRNQESLMQVPPAAPTGSTPEVGPARDLVTRSLDAAVEVLSEPDAKTLLAAYGIPVVRTVTAPSVEAAVSAGNELGYPVALKIVSATLSHKSDVGGVALDLDGPDALRKAARAMGARVAAAHPEAVLAGFSVQPMVRRPRAHELIVGVMTDAIFGPVILFGQGGTAVEVIADRAVALPPLNLALARDLIDRTRVARLLRGYRDRPAVDLEALGLTLVRLAQLVVDVPEIVELDVNPLFADETGVLALDARVRLARTRHAGADRLAIRPYPDELEEQLTLPDGPVLLRPIRPEDEPAHERFVARLSPQDMRWRFFGTIRQLPRSQMARLTQIDYDREMAFIATTLGDPAQRETLGVVRIATDPNNAVAEFAIVVRSDLKRQGLGRLLLEKMIRYVRSRGTRMIDGDVLRDNEGMLGLARDLGFERMPSDEPEIVRVRLDLTRERGAVVDRTSAVLAGEPGAGTKARRH